MQVELEQRDLLVCAWVVDHIMILGLTKLALQSTPDVRVDVLGFLLVLLAFEPLLDAS